jgi:hypothetical protein
MIKKIIGPFILIFLLVLLIAPAAFGSERNHDNVISNDSVQEQEEQLLEDYDDLSAVNTTGQLEIQNNQIAGEESRASGGISVGFEPATVNAGEGGEFTIGLKINNLTSGQEVMGFRHVFNFNPDLLEVVKAEVPVTSFLNPVLTAPVTYNNTTGRVELNLARSSYVYPGSSGVVYNVQMKVKAKGIATLTHAVVDLRDTQNHSLAVNPINGTVNVSSANVNFVPSAANVTKGGNFTMGVEISNLTAGQTILGFHHVFDFNPSLLEVVEVEIPGGSFFSPVLTSFPEYNNTTGRVELNLARSNSAYPGGSGVVYNIIMKAKAKGTSALTHSVADLRDAGNNPLGVMKTNGTVEINEFPGDFNGDTRIDFEDLMIFALAWNHKAGDPGWSQAEQSIPGSPFSQCDISPSSGTYPNLNITPDGKVDFEDLMVFTLIWNATR